MTKKIKFEELCEEIARCTAVEVDDYWLCYPSVECEDTPDVYIEIRQNEEDAPILFKRKGNEVSTLKDGICELTAIDGERHQLSLLYRMQP